MRALALVALLAPTVAFPATVMTATHPVSGETYTLLDEAGPCVKGAKAFIWRTADGSDAIPGCYAISEGVVLLAFFDGDSRRIPETAFKKAMSL